MTRTCIVYQESCPSTAQLSYLAPDEGRTRVTTTSDLSKALANNYAELRKLWSHDERRRADGGWWSLSGFSIQATIALDLFVRRALIEGASEAYAFEAVSDLSVAGDKVSLTQVKRTLTRSTLAAAVDEARIILDLCSPAFAHKLEFQIICERDETGLKPSDLTPSEVFDDPAATRVELHKVLERFNPTAPVKVMSSPGLSLRRTLLSAGVRDPDRVARNALGTLFDSFDGRDRDGVERALMRAISDIRANVRAEDVCPGRLLTPDMFERRAGRVKSLFVRARPRLSDLVGGRFLDRSDALRPLVEAAEAWLAGLDQSYAEDDLRLPILWLGGRPGDGKSVLTLQLLEQLIIRRNRIPSVTELASAGELSAWMKSAARREADNQAEIGFIDDIAAYVDRDGVEDLIDEAFYRGSPYVGLITCGTTEDSASFAIGSRVSLTSLKIKKPTTSDFEALRYWAEGRIGRRLPGISPEGASISEFMVNLTLVAPSRSSATRGLSADLKAAMAVNALGLAAPRSLISDQNTLAYASERPDIELSPMEETSGIRLAHAEAVWRLYIDATEETDLATSWGADLGRVLAMRAAKGEATEARTLLGALINTREAVRRLRRSGSQAPDTALLDAVYRAFIEGCSPSSRAPLFRLWLAAATSRRLSAIDISNLREEGRQLLAVEGGSSDAKAEVAASLIMMNRRNDDVARRSAASFLRRAGPVPAAARYAISALSKSFQGQAAEVALDWLVKNRKYPEIGEVLGRVLTVQAPLTLQHLAREYINQFMGRSESGAVLAALATLPRTKSFYQLQDRWLAQTNDAPRALGIYRDQLRGANWRRYIGRALPFIQAHPDIRGGQEILSLLLRKRGSDSDVLAAARAWLDHYVAQGVATPVLLELVAIQPLDAGDLERALLHIDRAAPGASSLFATLAVVLQALSQLERIGLRHKLPQRLLGIFDQATAWRVKKLEGRLKQLDERLHLGR
ncbi:hypothetical protein [Rhodopseudomonas sp.]|uniref:hypothetical protein n=1 Tax=Rhodopseudomonas sp. TaxID=1078 RepID=UPI003B3B3BFA